MRPLLSFCLTVFASGACGCSRSDETTQAAPAHSSLQAPASASAPAANATTPQKVETIEHAMGTEVHFVAYTTPKVDEAGVKKAFGLALAEIARLERLMSSWRNDSDVAAVNRNAGKPVPVSAETFEVVQKSLWAGRLSGGAFDVTFGSMNDVWKFGDAAEDTPKVPDKALVEQRRKLVDYRRIVLGDRDHSVAIGSNQRLDLGGIAKGYIVDRAAAVLRREGIESFLAQAGGDLFGSGRKPDGSPWVSGIQDPRAPRGQFFATIELENHAFSTAGDYARAFVIDGHRYHHIIDPRTGYPATACRSVTIWAEDAFTADAVDDIVFILGADKGLELVESLPGVGAVIVDHDNKVSISKRIAQAVHVLKAPTDGI